jgi:diguanylate cyclase (GGDEF)-like protein
MFQLLKGPAGPPDNDRMYSVINYSCYIGAPAHALFLAFFFWMGIPLLGIFNILSIAAWVFAWWINRRGHPQAAVITLAVEVVAHAVVAVLLTGWQAGFQTPILPLIAFLMIGHRVKARVMFTEALALLAIYTALYTYTKDFVAPGLSETTLQALNYMHIGLVFGGLCVVSYFYRQASVEAEKGMERLATTDQLTGLANRHRMRHLITQERSRSERTSRAFSLVICDIDRFKDINDKYGHDIGDEVLRRVADVLATTARVHDTVARWGGEEFLVLLPETELRGAIDAAERMRRATEQHTFGTFNVTLSFGVAVNRPSETTDDTLKRADNALYEGKHTGRNRVVAESAEADLGLASGDTTWRSATKR